MSSVRRVQYFYATVRGEPEDALGILGHLAGVGVDLLALNTMPLGPDAMQFTLFPADPPKLVDAAKAAGMVLEGPHSALLVQGEDQLGALAKLHGQLHRAGVQVYASSALTDGRGYYATVLYMRPQDADRAAGVLKA